MENVDIKEIITTIVRAVDLVNPILKNHHRRTAIIAYNIGKECGLSHRALLDLVVAASLHDVGALTVKDSVELSVLDVENPEPHSLLGSVMLMEFKPFAHVSEIVKYHHVNYAENISSVNIPKEAYILHMADRIEILFDRDVMAINQMKEIKGEIIRLRGRLFDPEVVDAFVHVSRKEFFWIDIDNVSIEDLFDRVDFDLFNVRKDEYDIEALAATLSRIIDFKSEYTAAHSARVSHVAYKIAQYMELEKKECKELKIAGYLHDIGKVAIPSEIIMKPEKLTTEEFNVMKTHPYHTYKILNKIHGFHNIAKWAGSHHERRDLSGYPRKLRGNQIGLEEELIAYADIFSALSEERAYRKSLPVNTVMEIIEDEFRDIVGENVFPILKEHSEELYEEISEIQVELDNVYHRGVI